MRQRYPARVVSTVVALLIAVALPPFAGSQPAQAQKPKISIVVSGFSAWFYLQQHVAIGAGLYDAEGLTPDVVDTNSGTRQAAAVMGGTGEIGQFSFPHVIKSAAKGGGLVAIATGYDAYPIQLVLSKKVAEAKGITAAMPIDQRIQSIKGLKIAISSPGASTDLFVRTLLIVRGMDPDKDIALQPVGAGAPQYSALEAGVVDGFAFGSPFTTMAVNKGLGIMLADPMTGEVPEFKGAPYQIVATSRQTLEQKPEILAKGLRALARAQKLIHENPAEAKRVARQWFKNMSDADYSAEFDAHVGGVPATATLTQEHFRRTVELMNLTEKEKLALDYLEAVAPDLGKRADKEIHGK
jgi:NitT/TauT family transport system substrate-binding protein